MLETPNSAVAPVIRELFGSVTNKQVSKPVMAMHVIKAGASRCTRRR